MPTRYCECGAKYRYPESSVGKRAKCKKCGAIIKLTPEEEDGTLSLADEPRNQPVDNTRGVLLNELYVGTLVYNRTTQKLKTPTRHNPKEEWVKTADACLRAGRTLRPCAARIRSAGTAGPAQPKGQQCSGRTLTSRTHCSRAVAPGAHSSALRARRASN